MCNLSVDRTTLANCNLLGRLLVDSHLFTTINTKSGRKLEDKVESRKS